MGTLNNPKDGPEETLERLHNLSKAAYTVGQLEKGTQGTVHLQFTITLSVNKRLSAMKKIHSEVHWELTRSQAADRYCQKSDTRIDGPWTFGIKPLNRASAVSWDHVRDLAKKGQME